MRLLAKPISSPSRVDKFPPPLLRFMRNNGSSRSSRGRSRASPIFLKNRDSNSITQEPEPSSPKVTCMGQVRVRRSKKERGAKRCKWIPTTLFCHQFHFWGRWNMKKVGSERKAREIQEDEVTVEDEVESKCGFEEDEGERFVFAKRATPPNNALLLMRCRSEPRRGSLKFWDSPLANREETEQKLDKDDKEEEVISQKEGRESRIEAETSRVPANALLLTRCKSEPGRRRGKTEVDACFWKRRLGFVDVSSTRF